MKMNAAQDRHVLHGHGWELVSAQTVLAIGNLPGRKQVCLYVQKVRDGSCVMYPLAYFTDAAAAQEALDIIDSMALVNP